jgi:hypothetical protein
MNRRLLVLGGAAVALLILVAAFFLFPRTNTNTNGFDVNAFGGNTNTAVNTNTSSTKEQEALKIRSLAIIFSELYASGPVSTTNRRLDELAEYLTSNLQVFAKGQAARPSAPVDPERVVAAKALTVAPSVQSDRRASAEITLQLSESVPSKPSQAAVVTYRALRLGLVKDGADWKVAEVSWGERVTL